MEKRLRFTLAHELGHFMIHSDYFKGIHELASKTSTDSTVITEREADALAAALLMPKGRVKVAFSRLHHKLKTESVIYQMAGLFNVSAQAMEIRLNKLGLIQ